MQPSQILQQGIALHRAGQLDEAEALYRQILAAVPRHAGARQMLGTLRLQQQRFEEALAEFDAALAIDPQAQNALMQKAQALLALGRVELALAHLEDALKTIPRLAPAWFLRGNVLLSLGQLDAALQSFDQAVAAEPRFAEAWVTRGVTLSHLRRHAEAIASHDRAIALQPANAEAWYGRAGALEELLQLDEALAAYDRVLSFRPDHPQALVNRGIVLMTLQRYGEAEKSFDKARAREREPGVAFGGLAAAALYACDWDKVAALKGEVEAVVRSGSAAISPGMLFGYSDDPQLLQRCAVSFAANITEPRPAPLWRGEVFRNAKIRVAYLSSDFHDHATAHLIAELFERHDRSQFEIWGVGFDSDDGSTWRRRLIASFDRFVDAAALPDRFVAQMLRDGEVDIALDLKGFTLGSRMGIFAQRPVPLQVNYLGFPGTLGADFYDYILADRIVLPEDDAAFYTEKIAWLPDCYQANDATRRVDMPLPSRTQVGLPEEGFVFCCFNNNWKISAPIFAVWMRLLAQVPGSLLWLLGDSRDAEANMRRKAAAAGIEPARLIFAPRLDVDLHLSRHRLADLLLDTLPYNAHTTASDALRLGVPIVTLTGRAFPGRVATSLLAAVGLSELAAQGLEEYERIALALARGGISAAREKLARNLPVTPLFDSDRFRRGIEAAYRTMWQRWQAGEPPASFAVAKD